MEKTNMPQGKIGPIVARPPESEIGEYEKIKEQIILASNTGEAVTYEMPKTREPESLRMGLNPLLNKAGFLTVHIRQIVAPTRDKDKNKLDGGVYLLWADPKPKDVQEQAAPVPMPQIPATAPAA